MQPYLLSILSGLMMTVSFPDTDWNFLAWVCLVPFFTAVEGRGWKETFRIGYVGGVAFYWSLFYWLNNVTVAGFLVLTLYLALYFPIFGIGMNWVKRKGRMPPWLFAPFFWTALEYVRTYLFTGLPWGVLGATQHRFIPLIQISSITGVYGVSFLVALVNAAVYDCAIKRGGRRVASVAAACAVVALCLVYGAANPSGSAPGERAVRVAMVQGNVPQEEKFGEGFQREIVRRFCDLTLSVAREKPDLIVWPETSAPGYYMHDPMLKSSLSSLQRETRIPLLFGSTHAVATDGGADYYNSAFLLDSHGVPIDRYDKIHLVLFGEVIPCKRFLPFLKGFVPFEEDFTPGEAPTVFSIPQGRFAVLICFEDIFPDLARWAVRRGARFLVNVTNDAWFGRTSQPYQHVAYAVFRCVENGVPMVRATNSGLSCYVDRYGRVYRVLRDGSGNELCVQGTAVENVDVSGSRTLYTRWGNVFAILCTIITAILLLI
jgi:apolipoprotein N-acyltransferase